MCCFTDKVTVGRRIPAALYIILLGCGAPTGQESPQDIIFLPLCGNSASPESTPTAQFSSLRREHPTDPPLPVHFWDLYGKTTEPPSLSSPTFSLSVETTYMISNVVDMGSLGSGGIQ